MKGTAWLFAPAVMVAILLVACGVGESPTAPAIGPAPGGGVGPSPGGGVGPAPGGGVGPSPGGGGGGPSPTPTPSGSPTPSPSPTTSPTPTPPVLTVTGLQVATGQPYEIKQDSTSCCGASTNGTDWLDWPYGIQHNFAPSATDPVFWIRTAIADTNAPNDPMITFTINRCADVIVVFGEKGNGPGCNIQGGVLMPDAYPSWIASGGFACSVFQCGGTVETFYHETLSFNDQVSGPNCSKTFGKGQVQLGPRKPSTVDSKMYTVFIQAPFDPAACP